ncbi:hypothetical protein C0989_011458 [Termitomyces sp. Mn162]|nr:hypothetical protein C0989_011458 [Termitomyces sp. Mn162]
MSQFRPTRASPPFKPTRLLEHVLSADVSVASTHGSISELTGLSPDDIDFLDAVINRAGPSVTDFSSVATAYRGVLRDRGLNPREAVYFEKLIKLGMMKGKNWGDKWNAVKARHSRASEPSNNNEHHDQLYRANLAKGRGAQFRTPVVSAEDTRSTPSHAADLDTPSSSFGISTSVKQSKRRPRVRTTTSSSSDDLRRNSLLLLPDTPPAKQQHRPWKFGASLTSDSENTCGQSTTRLAATRRSQLLTRESFGRKSLDSTVITPAAARKVIASARERRESVIIEDDAWNKIRMERDEAEADVFRRTQLLERCWKVWTQLYQWIMDGLLVRAVFRVWNARRQGKAVERLKASNLTYAAWSVWKQRLQQQSYNNDLALAFVMRSDSANMVSLFHKWRQAYAIHRDAHVVAVQYDTEQICYKALLVWRMKLREKLKMVRMAKRAVNFSAIRHAWKVWHEAMNRRATERRLAEFEKRRMGRVFYTWLLQARQVRQRRLAEKTVQSRIEKRILQCTLMAWTNHVIAIRLRELDIAQSHNVALQNVMFKKWQKVYAHRLEVLSLLQSYILVKREDNMRRVFTRWLGLARINRHRRITLKEKEDEFKISVVACFWDKWRDRFSAERLRPIECMIQTEKNALFRAFGLWHSKTKSLPAIRLYANNTKAKYFKTWRQAMPRALQATKAREIDRHSTIRKYLDKWVQIHRTKMALKAVA